MYYVFCASPKPSTPSNEERLQELEKQLKIENQKLAEINDQFPDIMRTNNSKTIQDHEKVHDAQFMVVYKLRDEIIKLGGPTIKFNINDFI